LNYSGPCKVWSVLVHPL